MLLIAAVLATEVHLHRTGADLIGVHHVRRGNLPVPFDLTFFAYFEIEDERPGQRFRVHLDLVDPDGHRATGVRSTATIPERSEPDIPQRWAPSFRIDGAYQTYGPHEWVLTLDSTVVAERLVHVMRPLDS